MMLSPFLTFLAFLTHASGLWQDLGIPFDDASDHK